MTASEVRTIRARAGLTQRAMARILRISDIKTVRRWETGEIKVSGPASIILEMLDAGELPERFRAP